MNKLIEMLKTFGPSRLASMVAVTVTLAAFFAFVVMRVSQPQMTLLFSGLSLEDSSAIVKDLEARGIKYELRGDGSSILAPKDQITRIRMQLAEKKLPVSGGVGYEIFDKGDTFSATSFVQNVNHVRALEGELSRTIKSINRIENARVHLVLPEKTLFNRDKNEPRASIVLRLRGELEPSQVRAIRNLVASAVQGLNPQRISIVDEGGRLLADGAQEGPGNQEAFDDRRNAQEQRYRRHVQEIVESVVGHGRARVQVAADMNFNRVQQTQELYDPESRVVRSTQTREENSSQTSTNGAVSVSNELPGGNTQGNGQGKDTSGKTEEIVNYEISRTTKTEVVEGGTVKKLSVAVLVDGTYTKTPDGQLNYQPRPQEELERIATLVRSAIGFDQSRGDQVEVVNLRFAEAPSSVPVTGTAPSLIDRFKMGDADLFSLLETGILAFVALIVMSMVLKPMVKRIITPSEYERAKAALAARLNSGDLNRLNDPGDININTMVQGEGQPQTVQTANGGTTVISDMGLQHASATQQMIARAQVTGEVHQQTITHIGELVDRNPKETAAILRKWMSEAA